MIVQTVALPVYNSSRIAWLAMEGLCHQEVSHGWELVICEEKHNQQLGEEFFMDYKDRLPDCERILYIELPEWVPLGRKWQIIGRECDPNSKSFLLQGSDDYSGRERLVISHEIISGGVDWLDFTRAYFYSFRSNLLRLYKFKGKRNLSIAFTSDFARSIPDCDLDRGIDTFLINSLREWNPEAVVLHSDHLIRDSIFTAGYNTISQTRQMMLRKAKRPFYPTAETIYTLPLPDDVRNKILQMHACPPSVLRALKPPADANDLIQWKRKFR